MQLAKIESKLLEKFYKKLYPTGSYPSNLYENAKVHKLSTNDIDDLTLRPIASDIGTTTYEAAKYLVYLLALLSKSKFTINNAEFPNGCKMVSFDVTSMFKNVPLEGTIEIVLKRIYDNNEITTNITK